MKHLIKTALLIMALLLPVSAAAFDYDFEVDGIYYNRLYGNEAAVTYNDYNYNSYSGNVVIPETVTYEGTTYSVTAIGHMAFRASAELTSIYIPCSVISIGSEAFGYCWNLTNIQVDNGNPKYDSRNNCNAIIETVSNTLIAGCKGTVIPNSVTSIGDYAFYECSNLSYIDIPYTVTSIGDKAFFSCDDLTSVTIPYSITSIGINPFSGCYNLASIHVEGGNPKYDSRDNCNAVIETASNTLIASCNGTVIPNSVTSIGDWAFAYSYNLTSIDIPNTVTSIGDWAFAYSYNLTSITIPYSVTSIGYGAFENTGWYNEQPDGVVYLGLMAFTYKGYMPNGTSITIKDGTLAIAGHAFDGCSGLSHIDIPNSVTTIGNSAFAGCDGLSSVTIPSSVTFIGHEAFVNCDNLANIQVVFGNPKYDSRDNCNAIIETASNILHIGCKGTIIPSSVTAIGDYAFHWCWGLTSIDIPNSVTSIGDYSFASCYNLTSIDIPNSVTSIGDYSFASCQALRSIEIPNSVISIGKQVFNTCASLTSVTLPNSIKSISEGMFVWCTRLTSINIPNSVSSIGYGAFYQCWGLTNIDIPDSVMMIDKYAFDGCKSLVGVTVPSKVTTIGDGAFHYCSSLDTINFNAVNCTDFSSTESELPFNNLNITTINIGDSVQRIPAYFAYGLSKLTSVNISKSVTFVGKQAFNSCPVIETVICEAEMPPTWNDLSMFSTNVYNHAPLYVPSGQEQDYKTDECWGQFATILAIGSGLKGDVDGNGLLNISDVTMIIDYLLGSDVTPFNLYNADVNGSGSISIADVVTLIDLLLGF